LCSPLTCYSKYNFELDWTVSSFIVFNNWVFISLDKLELLTRVVKTDLRLLTNSFKSFLRTI